MKIEIEITGDNEATASPWWVILNPGNRGMSAANMAHQITGPFFSRKAAEEHLKAKAHRFRPKAQVWCLSGSDSIQYRLAIEAAGGFR